MSLVADSSGTPMTVTEAPVATYDRTLYATQFGADPYGNVDSTDAINAFLLATGKQGRKGRVPAGTYLISATLWSHDTELGSYFNGGSIEGDGRGITIFKWIGPQADGSAMLVWSRNNSHLSGISFEGNFLASHGVAVQNAQTSRLSFDVQHTLEHGIVVPRQWPGINPVVTGGFNEECLLDRPRVDFCGLSELHEIRLRGTGLGGTFTLTFEGNTTAPIAWDADGAAVSAALLAANPTLASPATTEGGTGNNPFHVISGTLDTQMVIELTGFATGHHPAMTMDTTGITGTITAQAAVVVRQGYVANGIHFYNRDDPEDNTDTSTMTIFMPTCRTNYGSGIQLSGYFVKIVGGFFATNFVAGVYIRELAAGGPSIANFIEWPYTEGNTLCGIYAQYSYANWISQGPTLQGLVNEGTSNDVLLIPNGGGLRIIQPPVYALQLGNVGQHRLQVEDYASGAVVPLEINASYDRANTTSLNADGPVSIDLTGTGARDTQIVNLNANASSFAITGWVANHVIRLHIVNSDGTKTITWPATYKFAGGTPPTLGTGGPLSVDILELQYVTGSVVRVTVVGLALPA